MISRIHLNDALPDNVLAGYNAEGRVVCCLEVGAEVRFIMGTATTQVEAEEWEMCAAQDRRFRFQAAWVKQGFPCLAGVV